MDYAGTAPSVSNTANNVSGTYSGVINATNYSGVEEFHITGGSGADNIVTGIGADILVGGGGADTLTAGGGSDVIYGGVGDVISGGEDAGGADFDLLVLADFGDHRISYATDAVTGTTDTQSGRVDHLDASGNVDGSLTFTGIESIVFADNTAFTLKTAQLLLNNIPAVIITCPLELLEQGFEFTFILNRPCLQEITLLIINFSKLFLILNLLMRQLIWFFDLNHINEFITLIRKTGFHIVFVNP
jgi:hypothetical protein